MFCSITRVLHSNKLNFTVEFLSFRSADQSSKKTWNNMAQSYAEELKTANEEQTSRQSQLYPLSGVLFVPFYKNRTV